MQFEVRTMSPNLERHLIYTITTILPFFISLIIDPSVLYKMSFMKVNLMRYYGTEITVVLNIYAQF